MPSTDSSTPDLLEELLDKEIEARLDRFGAELTSRYRGAEPFPHIVIDDFLPSPLLQRALDSFPKPDALDWVRFEGEHEKKLAFPKVEKLPPPLRSILYFLNSAPALRFLGRLTGIEGLLPDPFFYGGGLHQIERGGRLEVHADFNMLPQLNLYRRLNLLLYLNPDWEEAYGGHLELWNPEMTRCERKVLPIFNRCVVFNTTSESYHGHPTPLTCPEGRARRSIATYYYTAPPINRDQVAWHSTLFQNRPQPRPVGRLKRAVKQILPPIVVSAIKALNHR